MRSVAQMMQGCTDWYNSEQEKPTKTHNIKILRINRGLMKPYKPIDPIGSIDYISFPALAPIKEGILTSTSPGPS